MGMSALPRWMRRKASTGPLIEPETELVVGLDWLGRPSLSPSVRQLNECRCHFWITRGMVRWCADSHREFDAEGEPPALSRTRSPSSLRSR